MAEMHEPTHSVSPLAPQVPTKTLLPPELFLDTNTYEFEQPAPSHPLAPQVPAKTLPPELFIDTDSDMCAWRTCMNNKNKMTNLLCLPPCTPGARQDTAAGAVH